MSSSGSLRKRGPTQCFYSEKPILVVSWTPKNPGRRFYGYNGFFLAPGCQAGHKCKFLQWHDDEIYKCGKVLIPEQRQWILTLEADIAGYKKREKRLLIYLGLSLVISGMLLCLMLLLVG
ncbi:hypothetical protein SO802_009258 [Lithocarpus litseifolius]|uniref:Zinc finger GRF-type domain-containing protein n=1 Tax=Lithocarpus litseifolius TaxID=425828 RepID=A0AAW2DF81_9ROSI